MQANIVIVGATRGFETLTYSIPAALDGHVQPGHRVLAPLRSRKVTGVVTEVGENLSVGQLKPILEVLEPRPLFDRAHLELMEFLASYYMVSIADAYRSVIPAVARVESRTAYRLATPPDLLRRAAFTPIEKKIIDAVTRRALSGKQIEKLGPTSQTRAAVAQFIADGTLERRDSTQGRHRGSTDLVARLSDGAIVNLDALRGSKQRGIVEAIANAGAAGKHVELLKTEIDGAGAAIKSLVRRGVVVIEEAEVAPHHAVPAGYDLSDEQQTALDAISPSIDSGSYQAFLLWGVTASGKTEIYLNLAARALAAGRNVLILVPEIALADEVVRSFRARFGRLVGIAHSAQTVTERWASWMAALGGQARVMIGPRSVIFAPIHDAGLIVVDEEHDASYKNEEGIRYHARDLAVALAGYSKCPIVLGSATPSSESFANSRRGRYRLIRLLRRVNERAMAAVEIVDMRREIAEARESAEVRKSADADRVAAKVKTVNGANTLSASHTPEAIPLSSALVAALRENLESGGQSMVFLNRRGFHNFLQCHICGNVIACPNCSVSMTFHLRDRSLRCHYCGNHDSAPDKCPECDGYGLQGQGFGTERLTQTLAAMMPTARIERMDSDTSGLRGRRNRYSGLHPDDHQGFRFSRRHAGGRGERRSRLEHARLPIRRAHFSIVDPGRGPRGTRRARGPGDYPDLRAQSLQYPRREGSGLRALYAPRVATAPRSDVSAVGAARDGANRGRGAAPGHAARRGSREIACAERDAGRTSRARTGASADRKNQAALPMASDGKISRAETDARGARGDARRSRPQCRTRRRISSDRYRSGEDAVSLR